MKVMVFDVGGTEIKYSLMDEDLNVYDQGYVPTPMDSFDSFSDVIYNIYAPHKDEAVGIAMSLPGFIDVKNGRCNGGGALVYNHGTDVGPLLSKRCGCKVVLENDGKAAAKAEFYKGSLQGCQNACVFVIGTGVGGGLIIDGKVVKGREFTAGEFSFLFTNAEKFDDFGTYVGYSCSTSGLLGMYKTLANEEEKIDGREFFRRLDNDVMAQAALETFSSNIAKQIYNLYWLLDLEKVAIGGGISRQPILAKTINDILNEIKSVGPLAKFLPNMKVEVVQAKFGNEANQIGALMTYIEENN